MPWNQLVRARNHIEERTVQTVTAAIAHRPPGPRHEANDNALFGELANQTVLAISQGEFQLVITMFSRCYQAALDYERANGCEMHKGAPCFNVGVAFLRSYDFAAAMHYFELAQEESRKTSGDAGWNIYRNPLFERNFWDVIDLAAQRYPVPLYEDFWGTRFDKAAAMADWDGLSDHSKVLYLMANGQRVRYRQLADQAAWDGSGSLALVYWTLVADLARLLETELKHRTGDTRTLYPVLRDNFHHTPWGDLSAAFTALHATHNVSDPASYTAAFPSLRAVIEGLRTASATRYTCCTRRGTRWPTRWTSAWSSSPGPIPRDSPATSCSPSAG